MTGETSHPLNIDAAMRSSISLGAHTFRLDLPPIPPRREASALVVRMPECRGVEVMSKAEREHSPPAFAEWLIELARRTRVPALEAMAA